MLHLPDMAKQGQQVKTIRIEERLPSFLNSPCQLNVTYQVAAKENFYLIYLKVVGDLEITCQRCMQEFDLAYENDTIIAVCRDDERAQQLLELYECIVSTNWQVDLDNLIIDELHLYVPQFHPEINDCDNEINEILTGKIETY